ncbi:putative membrane protein [Cedratvirus kamchatka]|uniref:Membrane protein n=1 Tax=Cedratvirus kamchatka TaxID=2716914 RepID=A0A6G8MY67_9VIRU|nr:putative membrane protein [Cedratvirus kamchatka]
MSLIIVVVVAIVLFLLLIPLFFFFFTLALVLSLLLLVAFLTYLVVDYFTREDEIPPEEEPLLPILPPKETPLIPLLPPPGSKSKEYRLSAPVTISGNTNSPIEEFSNIAIDEDGTWTVLFAFYVNATLIEKKLDIDVYIDNTLHSSYAVDFIGFLNFSTLTGGFSERLTRGSVISFRARAIRFSGAILLPEGTYVNLVKTS